MQWLQEKCSISAQRSTIRGCAQSGDLNGLQKLLRDKPCLINERCPVMEETPLHISAGYNRRDIVKLLLDWQGSEKVELEAKNVRGETPLHIAAMNGCTDIARLLINHGAFVEAKAITGMTPMHLAIRYSLRSGDCSIVETLLELEADCNVEDNRIMMAARLGAPESSKRAEARCAFDVFLSFRGHDTRKNFADHLFNALDQRGIITFRDDSDHDLPRGKIIWTELMRAIEESAYVLVIFSESYASSTWCLDELAKIVECKDIAGGSVMPIFYKVNPSDVRKIKGSIWRDFAKHEENFKEDTQKLEKWKAALKIVASLAGRELNDGYESQFIHKLVREIEDRLGNRFSYVARNLVGIESRIAKVIEHLRFRESDVRSIGIWGMPGIGKTTIARVVYDSMRSQFEGSSFLANVGEVSTEKNGLMHLQNKLLCDILRDDRLSVKDVHIGANMIKKRLQYKKVVLILDNVDDNEQLEYLAGDLNWFGRGSRIIITTRQMHLLRLYRVNAVYNAEKLTGEESLKLFSSKAFKSNHPSKGFEELVQRVIGYCDGLPLALDVLGCYLGSISSKEIWQSALDRLKECPEEKIFNRLRLSYDGLQEKEKKIFLDIACLFKGKDKNFVVEILENDRLYPKIGIEVLIDRSLITIENNKLWMHDLLQEMAWQIIRQKSPEEPGRQSQAKTTHLNYLPQGPEFEELEEQQKKKAIQAFNDSKMIIDELEKELSGIVGLRELKIQLRKWAKGMLLDKVRRALEVKVGAKRPPHMVFLGNPGTGKTMMARLLGKLLKMLGALPTDKVIEAQRTDLVGTGVGTTGPKTRKKIEEAEGGILFVDEAYRLMPRDSTKDFGLEALEEIMSVMDRGNVAVIFAGYREPMERVISCNEGFRRRVTKIFHFDDFTSDDLAKILFIRMNDEQEDSLFYGFKLDDACGEDVVAALIRSSINSERNN